jgi:LacI family transcriptional regulator
LRLIHEQACSGLHVDDLARAVGASRSTLYRRFTAALGRPPHREVLRLQLERARLLLLESDLSIERIAERAGFQHPEYLSVVFRRELGCAPSDLRKRRR